MRPGVRSIVASAALLLSAASGVMLAAPGANAAIGGRVSMRVVITAQAVTGSACQWAVTFNVSITNRSSGPATVASVSAGSYGALSRDGGLAAGAVLKRGTTRFSNLFSNGGTPESPCPAGPPGEAPDPLVLTVKTSAGSLTWNQSVSDPQVVTMMAQPQDSSATLSGSFDAASCRRYYFEFGAARSRTHKVGLSSAGCPNDGTSTQRADVTVSSLQPGTEYRYRLVVVLRNGRTLRGREIRFATTGGTSLPVGSVGMFGLAALVGCGLFVSERWRRRHQRAGR